MNSAVYIHEFAIVCALGEHTETVQRNLLSETPGSIVGQAQLTDGRAVPVGRTSFDPEMDLADTRCNQLADRCIRALESSVARHVNSVGPERLGVVVGTSTSGI